EEDQTDREPRRETHHAQPDRDRQASGRIPRSPVQLLQVETQEISRRRDRAANGRFSAGRLERSAEEREVPGDRPAGAEAHISSPDDYVASDSRVDPDIAEHRDHPAGDRCGDLDVAAEGGEPGSRRGGGEREKQGREDHQRRTRASAHFNPNTAGASNTRARRPREDCPRTDSDKASSAPGAVDTATATERTSERSRASAGAIAPRARPACSRPGSTGSAPSASPARKSAIARPA